MNLFEKLNKILLLESKHSNTIAMLEIRSPLNPPQVSYSYRPSGVKTTRIKTKGKNNKRQTKEIRYKTSMRQGITNAYVDGLANIQLNGFKQIEKEEGVKSQLRYKRDVRNFVICRDVVMKLSRSTKRAESKEWDRVVKGWLKEKEDYRAKIEKEAMDEFRKLVVLVRQPSGKPRETAKKIRRAKQDIKDLGFEVIERDSIPVDIKVSDFVEQEHTLDNMLRGIPLGLTMSDWQNRNFANFDPKELELAVANGYGSIQLSRLLKKIDEPSIAQFSRDFDDVLAATIFGLFLDDPDELKRAEARRWTSIHGPKRVFDQESGEFMLTTKYLGLYSSDLRVPLTHEELFTLLMNGYKIDEIRTGLSYQHVETRRAGNKDESMWEDGVVENAIKRIWNNRKKYYVLDSNEDMVKNLKSDWHDSEDLHRDRIVQAQLRRGIIGKDQAVRPTRKPPLGVEFESDEAIVSSVEPGSIASDAGIMPGDKITFFIDREIDTARELRSIEIHARGDVAVRIERDGSSMELTAMFPGAPRLLWMLPRREGDDRPRASDIQTMHMQNQKIPDFVWVVLTGFEGSESKGVEADPHWSKFYGQPVAKCPECIGGLKTLKRDEQCNTCGRVFGSRKPRAFPKSRTLPSGMVPAWYWANETDYQAHFGHSKNKDAMQARQKLDKRLRNLAAISDIDLPKDYSFGDVLAQLAELPAEERDEWPMSDIAAAHDREERNPFEKIYQEVYHSLRDKFGHVDVYDGVKKEQYPEGTYGAQIPKPWYTEMPRGQQRPMYSENVPAYVVMFRVFVGESRYRGSFEDRIKKFEWDIVTEFKPFLDDIAGDLADLPDGGRYFLEVEPDVHGLSAHIKADKVEVGYAELLNKPDKWSTGFEPDQPSSHFVRDMFTIYRMAWFLDQLSGGGETSYAPYLWKALSFDNKALVSGADLPKVSFQKCLEISKNHLEKGLSYEGLSILEMDIRNKIERGEISPKSAEALMLQKKKELMTVGGSFPGQFTALHDLERIIENAKVYDYTFNNTLPNYIKKFMRAQLELQAMADAHVFGLPKRRTSKELEKAKKMGGRAAAAARKAEKVWADYKDVVSGTVSEGGKLERGKFSKREYILTIARRIERILDYINVQNRYHMPHYNLYLALGMSYTVPNQFIETNIKTRMYEVVDASNLDQYAEYLLSAHQVDNPASANPELVREMLHMHNVDLNDIDTLRAFYVAQKPQLALLHLQSAIADLETIIKEKGSVLEGVDILFYKEDMKGTMKLGQFSSNPPDGYVVLNVNKSKSEKIADTGELTKTNGLAVFKECVKELRLFEISTSYRLGDRKLQRRQRAMEEKMVREIETGGERGGYFASKSLELNSNVIQIYVNKADGKASPIEIAEFDLFVELRHLFISTVRSSWSEHNDYGSLQHIKDKFVKWFKKQNPKYKKYELDLAELASEEGVDFDMSNNETIFVLNKMTEAIKEIHETATVKIGHDIETVESILGEK